MKPRFKKLSSQKQRFDSERSKYKPRSTSSKLERSLTPTPDHIYPSIEQSRLSDDEDENTVVAPWEQILRAASTTMSPKAPANGARPGGKSVHNPSDQNTKRPSGGKAPSVSMKTGSGSSSDSATSGSLEASPAPTIESVQKRNPSKGPSVFNFSAQPKAASQTGAAAQDKPSQLISSPISGARYTPTRAIPKSEPGKISAGGRGLPAENKLAKASGPGAFPGPAVATSLGEAKSSRNEKHSQPIQSPSFNATGSKSMEPTSSLGAGPARSTADLTAELRTLQSQPVSLFGGSNASTIIGQTAPAPGIGGPRATYPPNAALQTTAGHIGNSAGTGLKSDVPTSLFGPQPSSTSGLAKGPNGLTKSKLFQPGPGVSVAGVSTNGDTSEIEKGTARPLFGVPAFQQVQLQPGPSSIPSPGSFKSEQAPFASQYSKPGPDSGPGFRSSANFASDPPKVESAISSFKQLPNFRSPQQGRTTDEALTESQQWMSLRVSPDKKAAGQLAKSLFGPSQPATTSFSSKSRGSDTWDFAPAPTTLSSPFATRSAAFSDKSGTQPGDLYTGTPTATVAPSPKKGGSPVSAKSDAYQSSASQPTSDYSATAPNITNNEVRRTIRKLDKELSNTKNTLRKIERRLDGLSYTVHSHRVFLLLMLGFWLVLIWAAFGNMAGQITFGKGRH